MGTSRPMGRLVGILVGVGVGASSEPAEEDGCSSFTWVGVRRGVLVAVTRGKGVADGVKVSRGTKVAVELGGGVTVAVGDGV